MCGKEALEGSCGCLECSLLFACVASRCLGFVERGFGGLEGTEDLEEGEKVFACSCCEAVESMSD
jgi:hypothetical protein